MMAYVAENQPPALPPGQPSGPDDPTPPRGLERVDRVVDPEEYRRFQEFQRFQEYQRYVEVQGSGQPTIRVEEHLVEVREQLARIERVTNPPTWQKVLRNQWLHRAIWLVVLIVLATWGVPRLIHHYVGGDQPQNGASLHPGTVQGSGKLYDNPEDAVAEFYHVIMGGPPNNANACQVLTPAAQRQWSQLMGVTDCPAGVRKVYGELTAAQKDAYSNVQVPPAARTGPGMAQVSSCSIDLQSGAPRLGTFQLTQDTQQEWQVTGVAPDPNPCPPPPTTAAPPS
jgi:hypothetical protein